MEKLLTLGIDWQSIVVYAVNFGILYFLVAKYLVPRVVHFLDERRSTIKNSLEEADRLKKEFEAKMKKIEKEREQAKMLQMNEMKEIKKTLENERADLLEKMNTEKQKMFEEAEKDITERKSMLIKEVEGDVLKLVQDMVLYIVQHKLPPEMVEESVDDAWKQYKK